MTRGEGRATGPRRPAIVDISDDVSRGHESRFDSYHSRKLERWFGMSAVLEFLYEMGFDDQAANAAIASVSAVRPVRSIFASLDENRP
jgi:hypothetical protein